MVFVSFIILKETINQHTHHPDMRFLQVSLYFSIVAPIGLKIVHNIYVYV